MNKTVGGLLVEDLVGPLCLGEAVRRPGSFTCYRAWVVSVWDAAEVSDVFMLSLLFGYVLPN